MKFLPVSENERAEMLRAIGAPSVEALFASIPEPVRREPALPNPLSEIEIRRLMGSLAAKNANARDGAFFLGAGLYNHYVSAIADQMLYRRRVAHMDYGFHPPTISFPLIVHGALMIEPTETEGKGGARRVPLRHACDRPRGRGGPGDHPLGPHRHPSGAWTRSPRPGTSS